MKTRIQTPDGPRTIPDWAECHCVTTHRPNYIHPYPFALPDGTELWLCPNTYHQATTLLNLYKQLDGPPKAHRVGPQFNYFVRSLLTLYWNQVLEARANEKAFKEWQAIEGDVYELVKRTEAYE